MMTMAVHQSVCSGAEQRRMQCLMCALLPAEAQSPAQPRLTSQPVCNLTQPVRAAVLHQLQVGESQVSLLAAETSTLL